MSNVLLKGPNVAIDPKTGNPVVRTTPEHLIKKVYAVNGMVVIVGDVGGQEVERIVDRKEAIHRAKALNDMAAKAKYSDEFDNLMSLVNMFIEATKKAAEQANKPYTAVSVSMATSNQKLRA